MTPDEIAVLAKRVHDQEGWNLGSGSTREDRNTYWARVVGIVHYGHPTYNSAPDPRWHLKDGGGGRPQSDDVAVLMPERLFWDFIGGVGANGYTFRAGGHGNDRLPPEQNVYPPPRPQGSGSTPPVDPPVDPPTTPPTYDQVLTALSTLMAAVQGIQATLARQDGQLNQAASEALNAASRASEIKTQLANLPQVKSPSYVGRGSTKAFGGAFTITLTPTEE